MKKLFTFFAAAVLLFGITGVAYSIDVDIKPGSCPNPFNSKSKGSVPVAIVGTDVFDVYDVDVTSLALNGVPILPENVEYADVTEPGGLNEDCYTCFDADDNYNCDTDGDQINDSYCGDGFVDLIVKFDTQALAASIGYAEKGDCIPLVLTGYLNDGQTFIGGLDSVVVLKKIDID
jgi:hypothetical protein